MPDQTNQQMLGSSGTIVPSKVYVVRVKIGLLPSSSQHFIDASAMLRAACLGEISGLPPPLSPFAL